MINIGLKKLRRWWQIRTGNYETPIDGEVPFWVISLSINVVVILLLAKLILPHADFRKTVVVVGEETEVIELDESDQIPEIEFSDLDIEELSNDSSEQLEILTENETPLLEISIQPASIEVPVSDFGDMITESSFDLGRDQILTAVDTSGSVGNTVASATGAVDRLTQELLRSLEDNATMVVWLLDQSNSLTRQRDQIEDRMNRIYRELNLLEDANVAAFANADDKPFLTQVYAFGKRCAPVLKEPTDEVEKIKSAIASIERDTSGVENVFSAILKCLKDLKDYSKINRATGTKKRNVMLVVLCDETGDDADRADEAIKTCNKYGVPLYVIGVPAPFGRPETQIKWVDPDPKYDQRPQFAPVSQGPESLMPERLQLNFIGSNFRDLEMIDSGFGPFHLTRACYQTGGIYFAVHPNRRKGRVGSRETEVFASNLRYFFDADAMKKYRPDYVSASEYNERVRQSRSRAALVRAAGFPATEQFVARIFRFEKLDEAQFVRTVNSAQQSAAILQPRLDRLYDILKEGELDREKEASPRWQAGFDLAFGRVIAARLRAKSYNEMLALAKTRLKFASPKNNTWLLEASDRLSDTGSQNEKLAAKARSYLTRVVKDHPKTPWALLAKRELQTPFGWRWKETYTKPPEPRENRPRNNNGFANPRNPRPRENMEPPKQRRAVPKL